MARKKKNGKTAITKEIKGKNMGNTDLVTTNTSITTFIDETDIIDGAGFESADDTCYAIPFLTILQSGSPQCKRADGKYIEGAQDGMIFNTVTNEIIEGSDGITIIPCYFKHEYLEWVPRDSGGGLVQSGISPTDPRVINPAGGRDDKGNPITEDGNILVDTRNHYCLVKTSEDIWNPVIIAMTASQVRVSKQWMRIMRDIRIKTDSGAKLAPMFASQYKLATASVSNDQGAWWIWQVERLGFVSSVEEYQSAKAFYDEVHAGNVTGARNNVDADEDNTNDDIAPF